MTLKEWLDQTGWTQADLADRLGVSKPYLSLLINKRNEPSFKIAKKIWELTGGLVGFQGLSID